jgi:hypothetical protein
VWPRARFGLREVEVTAGGELGDGLRSLQDEAGSDRLVQRGEGSIENAFVVDDAAGFEPAGRCDDDLGSSRLDAAGQLRGRESAEDHRMHRAEASAREHRDGGFRDHRHIDDDTVALSDASVRERAGELGDSFGQLPVGESPHLASHRAIPDQRGPLPGT